MRERDRERERRERGRERERERKRESERERERETYRLKEKRNATLIFTGFILLSLSMISTTIMTFLIIDFFFLAVANSGYSEIELSSLGLR